MGELSPVHWLMFLALTIISVVNVAGYIPADYDDYSSARRPESLQEKGLYASTRWLRTA
jgi:hypothetical protein